MQALPSALTYPVPVPHRPEDDWTRPMPRTPGRRRDPRGPDRDRRREPGWDEDERYDARWDDDGDDPRYARYDPRRDTGDRYADRDPGGYADDDTRRYDDRYSEDSYDDRYADDYDDRYADEWAGRPARRSGGGRGEGPPPRRGRGGRPRYGFRRIAAILLALVLVYVLAMGWAVGSVWASIDEVDATPDGATRPPSARGSTYLLVGTDSREGLSDEERRELVTGSAEGSRADTLMVLHVGGPDGPVLVSVPRDSYVDIPGHGANKINAAYAQGGPELLVDTVEQATGIRMDGYLELGFGGFVEVVAAVGGVHMCLEEPVQDDRTRLDLPAGCQDLEGADALNYVRMRYSDPRGDLGRVERQRAFLSALASRMATPQTVLVPWRLHEVGTAVGRSLARGENTSAFELGRIGLAMRTLSSGEGQSLTVPVADADYRTAAGSTVLWDEAGADALWEALRTGGRLTVEP